MKVYIDVMGGDRPAEIIQGAVSAAKEHADITIVLAGSRELISDALSGAGIPDNIETEYTSEVITNDDSPTMAIKTKKDSSLVRVFDMLAKDDEALGVISAGSTGAVLTGATLLIGRMEGIYRPTLISHLPTMDGGSVCITDCGANMDSHPEWLVQFAVMGSAYMRAMTGKEEPRVALLNVGTEDHKGNTLLRETYPLLKSSDLNFVGNMEARDTLTGKYDVVVCDGYDGNVLLKGSEGAAKMVMKALKNAIMSSLSAKIGYLFMKKAFSELRRDMDYNNYGGGVFLGTKKPVIKAHGSSNAAAIKQCVNQLISIRRGNVYDVIRKGIDDSAK
ncbi:MAG TPA: phosphate acyltransferase PlsX [Candidatus Protoclostridium stercorigallinarum]|uniref:Phosphate acyltransferase n=1 Tax=Candidatus Protoclostridium stercorigallinarum TaxID=2838741 RepID=A0A9D1Q0M0_9FIRM|nr:phosphate acyltransferase PlsX [Candidatus Protoclostridium stercorigallinarum]